MRRSRFPERRSRAAKFKDGGGVKILAITLLPTLLTGCVSLDRLSARISPAPKTAWIPPPGSEPKPVAAPEVQIPPELESARQHWTLNELVDIGLGNNIQTRLAWGAARTAAAALGAAGASTWPKLTANINAAKSKGSAVGGRFVFDYGSLTPTASLTYLLFDFGGRRGLNEEARLVLAAANWAQNSAIQNVILQIEQNFYQYLSAKSLLTAQRASLKEAATNLDAAKARHAAGVATLADTLQAKTAFSRVELDVVSSEGLLHVLKGALANAAGLPANASFDVAGDLPASSPFAEASGEVDKFIAAAEAKRPDLAAARSLALKAEAHIKIVQSDGFPTLNFNGSIGRVYYSTPAQSNSLSAAVVLDIPLFRGFSNAFQVLQAKSEAENAKAQMKKVEQDVILQVWTSYQYVRTAAQSIRTAEDLFESARQSYDVTLAAYKEGVGSILDLLSAQSALENGRLQLVQSKAQWLTALVQLARDTGTLEPPGSKPADPDPMGHEKGGK